MKTTKKQLVKAAKELNEVLGLDPKIDLTQNLEGLTQGITEAADLIEPEDEFSQETLAVIKELRPANEEPEDEEDDEADEDTENEGTEDSDEDDAPEDEKPSQEDKKGKGKADKKKDNAKADKKDNVKSDSKKDDKKAKADKKDDYKEKTITRIAAATLVIKKEKKLTIEEWIEKTDVEFGKPNEKESRAAVIKTIHVLEAYGIAEKEGDVVKIIS